MNCYIVMRENELNTRYLATCFENFVYALFFLCRIPFMMLINVEIRKTNGSNISISIEYVQNFHV